MTPPRSVLTAWRALEAADRLRTEFDRRITDLESLSEVVRAACHRLDGDGWRGAAYDAVLAHVDAVHRRNRVLCDQAEALRDAGVHALSDLHYTALALLDYVADAEAAGCQVADDWTVTGAASAAEWAEIIAEAVAAVDRADDRGRRTIRTAGTDMLRLALAYDWFEQFVPRSGPPEPKPDTPDRSASSDDKAYNYGPNEQGQPATPSEATDSTPNEETEPTVPTGSAEPGDESGSKEDPSKPGDTPRSEGEAEGNPAESPDTQSSGAEGDPSESAGAPGDEAEADSAGPLDMSDGERTESNSADSDGMNSNGAEEVPSDPVVVPGGEGGAENGSIDPVGVPGGRGAQRDPEESAGAPGGGEESAGDAPEPVVVPNDEGGGAGDGSAEPVDAPGDDGAQGESEESTGAPGSDEEAAGDVPESAVVPGDVSGRGWFSRADRCAWR